MLRKLAAVFAALGLVAALPVPLQAQAVSNASASLTVKYDLDTPASVTVVTTVNLTNTTLTIAAQPTVAAELVFTIVDTTPSITDGDITVTGVDSHGVTRVEIIDASGGAGTYTTTYRYVSVTSIVTSAFVTLGGGGDETIGAATGLSTVYCTLSGSQGPFSDGREGPAPIETSGASLTVVESNTGSNPFAAVNVGDMIAVRQPSASVTSILAVDAKASAASITVSDLVDLGTAGVSWTYRTLQCGYDVTAGWVDTSAFQATMVCVEPIQWAATGASIDWHVEVKTDADGAGPIQAYPASGEQSVTTAGYEAGKCVNITTPHDALRVALGFAAGGDEGTDTGALKERITVTVTGTPSGTER